MAAWAIERTAEWLRRMGEIASRGQLRMARIRWALLLVPLLLVLGALSGALSGSGYRDRWFAALDKPAIVPPGWVFAAVWTALYVLMALALVIIVAARGARLRGPAIALFAVQLALNLAWAPLFFGAHEVTLAFWWTLLLLLAAAGTIWLFWRVRQSAGLLLLPYLAWLLFAAALNFEIDRRNPNAETLAVDGPSTQVDLR